MKPKINFPEEKNSRSFSLAKRSALLYVMVVCTAGILVLVNACKKTDSMVKQTAVPKNYTSNITNYTHSDWQQAMGDVNIDNGGHMVFKNMTHLATVLYAIDSLGDSTATAWEANLGFNSIKVQADKAADRYEAMGHDEQNTAQSDIQQFWSTNANVAVINENSFEINAGSPLLAWVLASDHIAVIGGNFLYSDINNEISGPWSNLQNLAAYKQDSTHLDTLTRVAVVKMARKTTSGSPICFANGTYGLSEINCGSPLQKKSTIVLSIDKIVGTLSWCSSWSNYVVYNNMNVNIVNYYRGAFGYWYKEKRGSQVIGYFNGNYYNASLTGSSARQSPSYQVYTSTFSCITSSSASYYVSSYTDCFGSATVYVLPMCGGATMSRSF